MLDDLLLKYGNQNVVVNAYSGFDQYANPTWSTTASTYTALIVQKVKAVRDRAGVEKVSNVQIYLSGNTTINIEDKITLPDATTPLIIAVQKYPGFSGTNILTEVFT